MRILSIPLTHLGEALLKLAGAILVFMLVAQVAIVALRYGFAIGAPWAQDLIIYCFCFSILLPVVAVVSGNTSVRVDIFYADMPRRWQSRVDRFALLLCLVPSLGYGAYRSFDATLISWKLLEASPTYGGLPGYYLLKTMVTVGLFLMAFAALVQGLDKEDPYFTAEYQQ